jgi:hypothetical protein
MKSIELRLLSYWGIMWPTHPLDWGTAAEVQNRVSLLAVGIAISIPDTLR